MTLVNRRTRNKRVLKRSKTGIETEFHIIDKEGMISSRAPEIISALAGYKENFVTKEIGKNMIEFMSYPDIESTNPIMDVIDSVQKAIEISDKKGLMLYPFGTYPGRFDPVFSEGKNYQIKEKIFGKERSKILCRNVSFHHHYTLPKGVFDAEKKVIRLLRKSKLERSMVSSYNLEIAADPVLTLFCQSSPFYQGVNLAKDSRVVTYRGGKKLRCMGGAYAKMQQIGGLPPYKQTATDLLSSLSRRWSRWKTIINKADPDADFDEIYPYKLEIGWHPVKLNKHGTLEQRGMDNNFMSIITGVTVMLKYILRKIQREFIEVLPADFGIDEAFKKENGIIYIPPHSYVRNKLQPWSAYYGYEKKEMYDYARRFINFAKTVVPKRDRIFLKPIENMVDTKISVADKILAYAKHKGYYNDGVISDDDAAQLALHFAKQYPKDLQKTHDLLMKKRI